MSRSFISTGQTHLPSELFFLMNVKFIHQKSIITSSSSFLVCNRLHTQLFPPSPPPFFFNKVVNYLHSSKEPKLHQLLHSLDPFHSHQTDLVPDPLINRSLKHRQRQQLITMFYFVSFPPHCIQDRLKCIFDTKKKLFFSLISSLISIRISYQTLVKEFCNIPLVMYSQTGAV